MTEPQLWALLIGFVAPPLIAVVQQPRWSSAAKACVMVLSSLLIGVGTAYFHHAFTGATVAANALIAAVSVGTAYESIWKPTKVAPWIERTSSRAPHHRAH